MLLLQKFMKEKINGLISSLGVRFGFDSHYFIKNTIWLLMGQALMSVAAFLATVVLANKMSKHDLGDFRLIVSIYTTLVFFTMSGLTGAFMRSIVNGFEGALEEAIAIKKRYGLLTFFIGCCVALYFFYKGNATFALLVLVASAAIPYIESYSMYSPYLQAKHEFRLSSLNQGLIKLISSIAVIVVAYFMPQTLYLVIAFYGSQAVVNFIQYKVLTKKFPPKNNNRDEAMLPYAKHLTLSGFAALIFGQADKFILYHFFGPAALASYWIASTVPQEVGRVVSTVVQVGYPKFVKVDHVNAKEYLPKRFLQSIGVLVLISLLYACIAYPFFHFFFPLYVGEVSKSIVLMFAFAIIPHYFVWGYFAAKGRHKIIYLSNTLDPVLQVLLYLVCIPLFGIWGLVYAMLIKTVLMNIVAWYVLKTQ